MTGQEKQAFVSSLSLDRGSPFWNMAFCIGLTITDPGRRRLNWPFRRGWNSQRLSPSRALT